MEEYRDLDLTVAAFRERARRARVPAARAPASCCRRTCPTRTRAAARSGLGAARGARAAARRSRCASSRAPTWRWSRSRPTLHGWPQAPYASKAEVDANYKRVLDVRLLDPSTPQRRAARRRQPQPVRRRLGLAARASERGVRAPHRVRDAPGHGRPRRPRAVRRRAGELLLYAPVVRAEDFDSAIAYLVRRLDENTAPENFLRHVFDLAPTPRGSPSATGSRPPSHALGTTCPTRRAARQDRVRAGRRRRPTAPFVERARHRSGARGQPRVDRRAGAWREQPGDGAAQIAGALITSAQRDATSTPGGAYRSRSPTGAVDARWSGRRAAARATPTRRSVLDAVGDVLAAAPRRPDRRDDASTAGKTVAEARPRGHRGDRLRPLLRAQAARARRAVARAADAEPLGVVVVAPPWNFPLAIPAGGVLAALAAGNAVILKPAPEAVLVGVAARRGAAGRRASPRDVLQFVPCRRRRGRARRSSPTRASTRVDPHRLVRDGAAVPRLAARSAACSPRRAARTRSSSPRCADLDQAVRDLVRSAFGHDGQKCSAASLAICRGRGLRRRRLPPPARATRRRASRVGQRVGPGEPRSTPLTEPPGDALRRALTTLDPGESGCSSRGRSSDDAPALVARHQARRAARLVLPPHRVLRPGARADARRRPRPGDRARRTRSRFGLTGGHPVARRPTRSRAGSTRVEAGNLYVNRRITGAIVRPPAVRRLEGLVGRARAPRPAARTTCLQLGRWRQVTLPASPRDALPGAMAELLAPLPRRSRPTPTPARCSGPARRATRARGASTSAGSTTRARSAASATCSAIGPVAA